MFIDELQVVEYSLGHMSGATHVNRAQQRALKIPRKTPKIVFLPTWRRKVLPVRFSSIFLFLSYKNFPSEIFDILQPLWPSSNEPKFSHFHSVINFLQRSACCDLADFWPILRFSECPKVCAFISQKLCQLCQLFFIFLDNFCHSIRIWQNFPSRGRGSGATVPQKRSQKPIFQNFHFFARFLWPNGQTQCSNADLILYNQGPAINSPYRVRGDPLNFDPRLPWAAHPQKHFPKFSKILEDGSKFSSALYGDPQGPLGIKFRQLYLGPLPQKKIPNFRRKSNFYRVTKISHMPKCAPIPPPRKWSKVQPDRFSFRDFPAINRISISLPCTQPPVREVYYV